MTAMTLHRSHMEYIQPSTNQVRVQLWTFLKVTLCDLKSSTFNSHPFSDLVPAHRTH